MIHSNLSECSTSEYGETAGSPTYLIINADDFGYYKCISKGILELAQKKRIMATGLMTNSPIIDKQIELLKSYTNLDVGIHLNLTYGAPLTSRMSSLLSASRGMFPGKGRMALSIIFRRIDIADIESEWRAQISRGINAGLPIRFLNSHEHIHMLPSLFRTTQMLAKEFAITHVRYTRADWNWSIYPIPLIRNIALGALGTANTITTIPLPIRLIGLEQSGRITLDYLKKLFSSLTPGNIYELMCHPGYFDSSEILDRKLRSYHKWEQELNVFASQEVCDLFDRLHIKLIRYRDLDKL